MASVRLSGNDRADGDATIETRAAPKGLNRLEFRANVGTGDRGQRDRIVSLNGLQVFQAPMGSQVFANDSAP